MDLVTSSRYVCFADADSNCTFFIEKFVTCSLNRRGGLIEIGTAASCYPVFTSELTQQSELEPLSLGSRG